ncbi:MAG: GNAT family N-acetyltransferase [Bacteroidota bacterium]
MTVHRLDAPDAGLAGPLAPLAPEMWALTRPDRHLAVTEEGECVARASLWWRNTPSLPDDPAAHVGLVGHVAAARDEAAGAVLAAALDELRTAGAAYALGPMDGSTWQAYRLVTETAPEGEGPEPPFFLEPWTPPEAVAWFRQAGFAPVAGYYSARVPALPPRADALGEAEARLAETSLRLRAFRLEQAEAELGRLYRVALAAFAGNPFYTPQPEAVFRASYRQLLPHVRPELLVLAERESALVGFVFAVPDLAQAQRRETVDTVIVKTVAVHPDARGEGLGGALVLRVQEAARRLGFRRGLHALMHEANVSVRISRHNSAYPMRRYALFGRPL